MSAKIYNLGSGWGATAMLTSALQQIPDEEQVAVLFYDSNGNPEIKSSNLTGAELLYLIEGFKRKLLNGDYHAERE